MKPGKQDSCGFCFDNTDSRARDAGFRMLLPSSVDVPESNILETKLPLDFPRASIAILLQGDHSNSMLLAGAKQHTAQKFKLGISGKDDGLEGTTRMLGKAGRNVVKSNDRGVPITSSQAPWACTL